MGLHTTDREIGIRAAGEIYRLCQCKKLNGTLNISAEGRRLGIDQSSISAWKRGQITPTVQTLSILARHGYDVHYILTGFRRNNHE